MPYAVSGWPNSNDPRPTWFGAIGYQWGALPPWKLSLATTGAEFGFSTLNQPNILTAVPPSSNALQWTKPVTVDFPILINLWAYLDPEPVGTPPRTVRLLLQITPEFSYTYSGESLLVYPHAITGWPSITVLDGSGLPGDVPNPVTIEPRIWNYPNNP